MLFKILNILNLLKGIMFTKDIRTKDALNKFLAHDKVVKSVCVHPTQKNYFVTCSNDALVKIFDVRNIKPNRLHKLAKPLVTIKNHSRTVNR